jgi:hypothetical protein
MAGIVLEVIWAISALGRPAKWRKTISMRCGGGRAVTASTLKQPQPNTVGQRAVDEVGAAFLGTPDEAAVISVCCQRHSRAQRVCLPRLSQVTGVIGNDVRRFRSGCV